MKKKENVDDCDFIGKEGDFHILHLSDLHISGKVLGDRFDKMFADIAKQTAAIDSLVIVVTGDIASRGEVLESQDAILDFFKRLKKAVHSKIIDVELVPGNHDIDRKCLLLPDSCEESLKQYNDICPQIYKALGKEYKSGKKIFGESAVRFGDRSVCFLRMDTSWFLPEGNISDVIGQGMAASQEFKHLEGEVREKKLDELVKQRKRLIEKHVQELDKRIKDDLEGCREKQKKAGFPVAVTFALAHHPLSWLLKTSCERYADFLLSKGLRNVDMWLCGHAHDVQIHYDNDNNQSTVVLMTGVGTEETGKDIHRYSIYKFSLIRNIFAIKIRAALSGGKFSDDRSLLSTDISEKRQHFCYPLKTVTPGAVIALNGSRGFDAKEMYVDQAALVLMQSVVERMKQLGIGLMGVVRKHLNGALIKILGSNHSKDDVIYRAFFGREPAALKSKEWQNILRAQSSCVEEEFVGLLEDICAHVISVIVMKIDSEAELKKTITFNAKRDFWKTEWRVHFRVVDTKRGKNKEVRYVSVASKGKEGRDYNMPKSVPWDSFIKKAYRHKRNALVKSANDCKNAISTEWDDFLTTTLKFSKNDIRIKGEKYPFLTFGVSVKEQNYESRHVARRILYLLDFYDFNSIVSKAVEEFVTRLGLELRPGMLLGGLK